ncbi:MAG: hypothetical protein JW719_02675, partial [Pirellulales bacterium]|nr:hypothetical protein [Pirellulales bacterium]
FLHTGQTADGLWRFVGFAPGRQQVHLFDENWKRLWSFPSDGQKNPHAGIGDVRLADLDGESDPEICIGYRGLVGVKAVSIAGKPLWSQRSLADVFKMAVGAPGKDQRDLLFATNDQCTLALLDGQGKVAGRLEVPGRLLYWIAAADLDADGQTELCGLSADLEGNNLALGMTPDGQLQWKHDLPRGLPGPMVELAVPAWLRSEGPGQWVLLGADASLHVVSAQGEPIDRFNYGEPIMGVAFAQLGGKPALILSTRGKVEALTVSWPDNAPR